MLWVYSRLFCLCPRTHSEKDFRSLPRSTLRWLSWASAGSWSASACWVRISLPTVAALPLRLLRYAPLEDKCSEYLYPLHLSPCLVIAVSGVEDATAAIRNTRDNKGLLHFCHRLVCRSVSACYSTLGINWYKHRTHRLHAKGVRDDDLLCVPPVLEVQQVTVSRTTILCRSLWRFMQHVESTRGILFPVSIRMSAAVFSHLRNVSCCQWGAKSLLFHKNLLFEHCADLLKLKS